MPKQDSHQKNFRDRPHFHFSSPSPNKIDNTFASQPPPICVESLLGDSRIKKEVKYQEAFCIYIIIIFQIESTNRKPVTKGESLDYLDMEGCVEKCFTFASTLAISNHKFNLTYFNGKENFTFDNRSLVSTSCSATVERNTNLQRMDVSIDKCLAFCSTLVTSKQKFTLNIYNGKESFFFDNKDDVPFYSSGTVTFAGKPNEKKKKSL